MRALKLATENGVRVGRTPRTKRLAAKPATDAARLARALARIKEDAVASLAIAEEAERILQAALRISHTDDMLLMRAMAREACVNGSLAYRFRGLIRLIEMAEEGTLCA